MVNEKGVEQTPVVPMHGREEDEEPVVEANPWKDLDDLQDLDGAEEEAQHKEMQDSAFEKELDRLVEEVDLASREEEKERPPMLPHTPDPTPTKRHPKADTAPSLLDTLHGEGIDVHV